MVIYKALQFELDILKKNEYCLVKNILLKQLQFITKCGEIMKNNCIFKETAYRLKENGTNSVLLPKIPCHPIGYAAAKILLRYAGNACVTVINVLHLA